MKQYELALRNNKRKSYITITWIIIAANILSLVLLAAAGSIDKIELAATIFLLGVAIFLPKYVDRKEKIETSVIFLILMITWISNSFWWVAGINLIFEIFQIAALRKLIVNINSQKIVYPSFPQKNIDWKRLNNLILKDGLLTIEFKNNRIIQQLIDEKQTSIDEKEFNEFCKQQLNK
jgi:hypothetical protein